MIDNHILVELRRFFFSRTRRQTVARSESGVRHLAVGYQAMISL